MQVACKGGIGYVRRDSFGRVFVDKCATDKEHLTKTPQPGQERTKCRWYVEDLLNSLVDKKGYMSIEISFLPLEEAKPETKVLEGKVHLKVL
jgi:hypothetical protein